MEKMKGIICAKGRGKGIIIFGETIEKGIIFAQRQEEGVIFFGEGIEEEMNE